MPNPQNTNSFVLANDLLQSLGGATTTQPGTPSLSQSAATNPSRASCRFLVNPKFPDAKYSFSGLFLYDNSLLQIANFISLLNGATSPEPKFQVGMISGAPPCAWNLDWYATRQLVRPAKITETMKRYIEKLKRNDVFALEFDNPFIDDSVLDDFVGSVLLKTFATLPRLNVVVASEKLAEHVRKQFPAAAIFAQENKVIAEDGRGNVDYYCDAAKRFSRVALHPADACDVAFLEKLAASAPAEKFEIPLNDVCSRNCSVRKEYIAALARIRREPFNAKLMQERHAILQKLGSETVEKAPPAAEARPAALTRDEFARAYELGFRYFKVQAEKLRSEMAFFWQIFNLTLNDAPEVWHKRATTTAALSMNVLEETPVVKTGVGAFTMRKFD
ncbi:MAG: hypothetical protein LUD39_05330 [Opitutae bacterium]|nr:hypothetical protein [Opitutae bacterium]